MTKEACQRMHANAAADMFLMTSGVATGQIHTVDGGTLLV